MPTMHRKNEKLTSSIEISNMKLLNQNCCKGSLHWRPRINSLNKLLNEVHISETDKGNEVKLVRANLIEEIVRVQNFQMKNEDDLRKENDVLSYKYSESIKKFKETLKKTEEDNIMLQKEVRRNYSREQEK